MQSLFDKTGDGSPSYLVRRRTVPCLILSYYLRKKISVSIRKIGIRIDTDQTMYPKKLGILMPFSSAMDLTMKFGAFPM